MMRIDYTQKVILAEQALDHLCFGDVTVVPSKCKILELNESQHKPLVCKTNNLFAGPAQTWQICARTAQQ